MLSIAAILIFGIQYAHCYIVTQIPTPDIKTGVSVHWDDCTQSLYFVDFLATGQSHSIYRYDLNAGKLYSAYIEGESQPIHIFPIKECGRYKNMFAVGLVNDTKIIRWNKSSTVASVMSTLFELELNDPNTRLVIGRGDPKGRLFQGTFPVNFCSGPVNSSMYMYSKAKGVQRLFGNVVTTTGLAFNSAAGTVYHLDSCLSQIVEFDQDEKTGNICNGRIVFDFKRNHGIPYFVPLGLEADSNGILYVANYTEGSIAKINPRTSSLIGLIEIPVKALASIAFGGKRHDILFGIAGLSVLDVNTGLIAAQAPANGYLYAISNLGAKGQRFSRLII